MRFVEPPERLRRIHAAVMFKKMPLEDVADLFGLEEAEVQEIVRRVQAWYVASTPAWAEELSPRQRIQLSLREQADCLNMLCGEAYAAWERKQTTRTIQLDSAGNVVSTKIKESAGDPRYLRLYVQLVSVKCKAEMRAMAELAKLRRELLFEEASTPPVGDCTAQAPVQPCEDDLDSPTESANDWSEYGYDDHVGADHTENASEKTPAQLAEGSVQDVVSLPPDEGCARRTPEEFPGEAGFASPTDLGERTYANSSTGVDTPIHDAKRPGRATAGRRQSRKAKKLARQIKRRLRKLASR